MACSVSSQSGSCCIPRWGLSIQSPVSLLLIKFSETMGNILAFIKQLRDGGLENIDEKYHIFHLKFECMDKPTHKRDRQTNTAFYNIDSCLIFLAHFK